MDTPPSADRAVTLIRRQRHNFINHLQVISGWLQLNKPERARQYLNQVVSAMTAESAVLRHVPAELGLTILELHVEAENLGVTIDWRTTGPGPFGGETGQIHAQVAAALQAAAAAPDPAGRRVVVVLTPGGISVHTPVESGQG